MKLKIIDFRPSFKNDDQTKVGDSLPNGFRCPGGKLGIHPALPHPTSCRLYYVCLNGVTPNEAGCGSGLVFNEESARCDQPENVPGCEGFEKCFYCRIGNSTHFARKDETLE